jgi:hypothetical protein
MQRLRKREKEKKRETETWGGRETRRLGMERQRYGETEIWRDRDMEGQKYGEIEIWGARDKYRQKHIQIDRDRGTGRPDTERRGNRETKMERRDRDMERYIYSGTHIDI